MAKTDMAVRISSRHYKTVQRMAKENRISIKTTMEMCIEGTDIRKRRAEEAIQFLANNRTSGCNEMKVVLEKQGVINKEK